MGEKEISGDTYPQHGSIQLETLASSTQLEIQPNGDNIVPKKKIKVTGSQNLVSTCFFVVCLFRSKPDLVQCFPSYNITAVSHCLDHTFISFS